MQLTEAHLSALARAIQFEADGISDAIEPKHRDFILRDIERLREVRLLVRQIVFEPGLPLMHVQPADPMELDSVGHTHSKSGT